MNATEVSQHCENFNIFCSAFHVRKKMIPVIAKTQIVCNLDLSQSI